ncbi:MAG: hypothetical protein H6657_16590 [Ardenticatenaceae bacterium]|nr:hypothetical protein [Anaerolineales bacterium]MCB8979033.1 hypothetical protein [Ardenticatenaceae bacterium]
MPTYEQRRLRLDGTLWQELNWLKVSNGRFFLTYASFWPLYRTETECSID